MIRVYNRIKSENLQSKLILQIHDELIVDCVAEELEKIEIETELIEKVTDKEKKEIQKQ